MVNNNCFSLNKDAIKVPYTEEIASYCIPFSCENQDLDEFFSKDALLYDTELLGKTYAWLDAGDTKRILALVTLANDSVKLPHRQKTDCNAVS